MIGHSVRVLNFELSTLSFELSSRKGGEEMFSDPNIVEWMGGLLMLVISLAIMVGISFLFALTTIKVLDGEDIQAQGEQGTLDTKTAQKKRRTAA